MPSLISVLTCIAVLSPVINGITTRQQQNNQWGHSECDPYRGPADGFGKLENFAFSYDNGRQKLVAHPHTDYQGQTICKSDKTNAIRISHDLKHDVAMRLQGDGVDGKTMGGALVPVGKQCIYKFTTAQLFSANRIAKGVNVCVDLLRLQSMDLK